MIKTDIVAYVSSYALEGELIVPSAVLTSTPQEQEINLTYTPNFQLKLMDKNSYVVDDAWMSFSYSDTNYTAYMNVVNRTQDGIVTLQYNNGLTTEEIPTPEPEPEPVDPLDSMLTIAGPLTSNSDGNYDSIVYTQESQNVYMQSAGMTYDSTNNRYEFAADVQSALIKLCAPATHTFETVTFVNLDSTYKAVLLQMGNVGYGTVTEDVDGNLMWSRTTDYDPTEGLPSLDFTQIIQQVGADITYEEIRITMAPYVAPEPTSPRFTSPAHGDLITGTIDSGTPEITYPIELEYGDGTSIPYDITSQHVTCDNSDITIGHTDDVYEDGQSNISSVYISINQAGVGQATLTYEDPDTGDTCTVTFDYDITEAAHAPEPTILTSASIRTLNGDNETGDPCSYPDPEPDNPTITIDENLEMTFDTSPSIICYNSTDGTNNYIKFEVGNFYFTALGNAIAQVIVTLDPSFYNDTSHLDVQPNADNQLVFAEVLDMTFSLSLGSTPLYITQIEVSYIA